MMMMMMMMTEVRQVGSAQRAVSEYKTHSDSQVTVYKDDERISSTDSGVSARSLLYTQRQR